MLKNLSAMPETPGFDPPGGGNGNPLQYSCLENTMDRGVWWATVHGVAKNQCPARCDPMDSSPPGSPVHGILQARILEWVAISSSRGSSQPTLQSCLTLCNPIDGSPPGSSVSGILQARILEWVAISFSKGLFLTRDQTQVSHIADSLLTKPPG